jgi:hypothetical protein
VLHAPDSFTGLGLDLREQRIERTAREKVTIDEECVPRLGEQRDRKSRHGKFRRHWGAGNVIPQPPVFDRRGAPVEAGLAQVIQHDGVDGNAGGVAAQRVSTNPEGFSFAAIVAYKYAMLHGFLI